MLLLNPTEARVLGCLIEKEITTPDYYPLTLNATVNACNQKSSREPVMELTEADVRTALFDMEGLGLVRAVSDSRVPKFEHRIRDVLNLRRDEVAVLCLLMLRGPQTPPNCAPAPSASTPSTTTPRASPHSNASPHEKNPSPS